MGLKSYAGELLSYPRPAAHTGLDDVKNHPLFFSLSSFIGKLHANRDPSAAAVILCEKKRCYICISVAIATTGNVVLASHLPSEAPLTLSPDFLFGFPLGFAYQTPTLAASLRRAALASCSSFKGQNLMCDCDDS